MFKPKMTKEDWARKLILPLYTEGYIETLWNTRKPQGKRGWILKSGKWVLWFFNMRPAGSSPELFYDICTSMAEMIISHDKVQMLIGVEMAGVSLAGAVSRAIYDMGYSIMNGYTRPLPKKVRKPEECLALIRQIDGEVADFSEKEYVEGKLEWARHVAIIDDMATDLGSKIIARLIVLWQAGLRNAQVTCNDIFYFLNRTKGNIQKGLDFANETEAGLYPASLNVDFVIEMDDYFGDLKKVMNSGEFEMFKMYQENPNLFDGSEEGMKNRGEVISLAARGL